METKSNEHFLHFFKDIQGIKYSHHFMRDVKHEESLRDIDKKILDPEESAFTELHKFEENIEGSHIFRAKKEQFHIVYAVTDEKELVFLRAIKNFTEYEKFLADKKGIKELINSIR